MTSFRLSQESDRRTGKLKRKEAQKSRQETPQSVPTLYSFSSGPIQDKIHGISLTPLHFHEPRCGYLTTPEFPRGLAEEMRMDLFGAVAGGIESAK